MQHLNNYVVSICFVMIFCIVVEVLTPSERYKGIIKIVSGIFILYTLITPIKGLLNPQIYEFDFRNFSSVNIGEYKTYEEKTKSLFDKALSDAIEDTIESELVAVYGNINIDVTFDNSEIVISGFPSEKHDEIYAYVEKGYGIKPIITE